MKKRLSLLAFIFMAGYVSANAQLIDVIGLLTDKVIKAIDLKVQALQNQTINLQIIQKQAENALSRQNLDEIKDWVEKQKDLYKDYYASLKQVKPVIAESNQVRKMMQQQKELAALYQMAVSKTRLDAHFSEKEKAGIFNQYSAILEENTRTLNRLVQTVNANTIRLSDAERIKRINQAGNVLEGLLYKLQTIYARNQQVSLQRAKDLDEINNLKQLYGLR